MGHFRSVQIAGSRVFAVALASSLVNGSACLSTGDQAGNVTCVGFCVGPVVMASRAEAMGGFKDCLATKDERARVAWVCLMFFQRPRVTVAIGELVIPIEVGVGYEVFGLFVASRALWDG